MESFERICNRFSSGSNIGSLRSISEESTSELLSSDLGRKAPQTVVVDSQRSIAGYAGSGLLSVAHSRSSSSVEAPAGPTRSSNFLTERIGLGPAKVSVSRVSTNEGDETLVESGSERSNRGLVFGLENENDRTLFEVEEFGHKEGLSKVVVTEEEDEANAEPASAVQKPKSRLPIFRIPNRLSQLSRMSRLSGSSSKRSLSSFKSRNSSSTISTQASRTREGEGSVKNSIDVRMPVLIKPVLPLRVVKRFGTSASLVEPL